MAGKEVFLFLQAYALQWICCFNNIILCSAILTQQKYVKFIYRDRVICQVDYAIVEIDPQPKS